MLFVELLEESTTSEAIDFLKEKEDFALFLLGNLQTHGSKLSSAPNSGNFKLLRLDGKICTVFCLTRRGNLLVQSDRSDSLTLETILKACEDEDLPLLGLLGEWSFSSQFWPLFFQKKILSKEVFASKQRLYTLELTQVQPPQDPHVRSLLPKDYEKWRPLRLDYLKEEGLPHDLSEEQLQALFLEKAEGNISWGYFLDGELLSMAELNAKTLDLGQVGGVYTQPLHRRKGYGKAVMHKLISDAKNTHKLRKLIIFTGEENHPARKLYESLGVKPSGHYALFFGS